ncbi:MAG TPA: hypothetical protein VIW24_01095 [Aldersonia sp.]
MSTARRMWQLIEPLHAVSYFTPEARSAYDDAGLRGFWMGYVAGRVAPLGPVPPAVATALFYGFHPDRAARALPDAWEFADPEQVLAARLAGATAALDRMLDRDVTEAADLLWPAARAAPSAGRALGAANQALPEPDDPLARLWQATTTLRELRGDGHVAALVANDVDPIASHLLKAAAGESDGAWLQKARSWGDDDWAAATERVRARGWLEADGQLTDAGASVRDRVEAQTDAAAAGPWEAIGPERTRRLSGLLQPLVSEVLESGTLPRINPIGLVVSEVSEQE